MGDDRCPARHRLDDAVAERLVEVDEVQEGVGGTEHGRPFGAADGSDVAHAVVVEVRHDLLVEVSLVVDDASDDEAAAGQSGGRDRVLGAFVRVDPTEEQQVIAWTWSIAKASVSMPWWIVAA